MRRLSVLTILILCIGALSGPATADERISAVAKGGSGCWNYECADKLPESTGCDADPYLRNVTSRSGYGGVGRVQARYSTLCHAYWGRYDPQGALPSCWDLRIQIQVGARNSAGVIEPIKTQTRDGDKCSWTWTRMMGAGERWARVRSGYLHCSYQNPCDVSWTAWSAWGKF